jgi:hypothetical protein
VGFQRRTVRSLPPVMQYLPSDVKRVMWMGPSLCPRSCETGTEGQVSPSVVMVHDTVMSWMYGGWWVLGVGGLSARGDHRLPTNISESQPLLFLCSSLVIQYDINSYLPSQLRSVATNKM